MAGTRGARPLSHRRAVAEESSPKPLTPDRGREADPVRIVRRGSVRHDGCSAVAQVPSGACGACAPGSSTNSLWRRGRPPTVCRASSKKAPDTDAEPRPPARAPALSPPTNAKWSQIRHDIPVKMSRADHTETQQVVSPSCPSQPTSALFASRTRHRYNDTVPQGDRTLHDRCNRWKGVDRRC